MNLACFPLSLIRTGQSAAVRDIGEDEGAGVVSSGEGRHGDDQ